MQRNQNVLSKEKKAILYHCFAVRSAGIYLQIHKNGTMSDTNTCDQLPWPVLTLGSIVLGSFI